MVRFCPNCGTEVDDSAVFCPTCGQAIDQDAEIDMPPAPAWPEPSPRAADAQVEMEPVAPEPAAAEDEPPLEPAWETIPRRPPEAGPAAAGAASGQVDTPTAVTDRPSDAASPNDAGSGLDLPFTMPVMLSGWLIGGGSLVGALGALASLFSGSVNLVELLLLVGLGGVAATVFLSASFPTIPNLRLATMAIVLVGFGVALDRLSLGAAGIGELLLLLGTAAAAMGAIILEIGRDQPMGTSAG